MGTFGGGLAVGMSMVQPSGGGAAPAVLSYPATLDIGDNPSATITFDNVSADKSGCGVTLAIGSPFTLSSSTFGPLAPAGSAVITVSTTATGAQSGTLTATGSDGPISIPITSAYSYIPAGIAGYLADYDAQYQAVVADNTTLTSVLDRGPNGYNTTGVTQTPKYRTGANGINGFPCFRFDAGGTDNAFFSLPTAIRSAIGTAGEGEYFAVVTAVASSNGGEPLGIGNRPSSGGLYPLGANGIYSSFVAQNQRSLSTISVSPVTSPHVMGISHSGTALFSYTNGSQRGTTNDTLTAGTSFCQFPDRYNNTTSFKGQIGQLIIYNRRLTTQERTDVVDFLKTRWGI